MLEVHQSTKVRGYVLFCGIHYIAVHCVNTNACP